ncbi:MAG: hypothetical protein ACRDT8_16115 [Micromonosporaceae bacterium]
MGPLLRKLTRFLHSPQGRRTTDAGRRYLARPDVQHKLRGLLARLRGRR